jgi:ankyrin repeat protein
MDAVPLAPRPQLDHYRKLAKELLAASRAEDTEALRDWADRWFMALARLHGQEDPDRAEVALGSNARALERHARRDSPRTLAGAQRLLAQMHGFSSWREFAGQIRMLGDEDTPAGRFEAGADAVVAGDLVRLQALLRRDPALIRAVSGRRHRSTLLHYVAANGVEDFRQITPLNIVAVARVLLEAGAGVDAPNHDYSGGGTALGLVATSVHPARAGVQLALMELLVGAGAAVDGLPGGWQPLSAALGNGCPEAAAWLADHGASLTFESAAGLGRLQVVEQGFDTDGRPRVSPREIERAFHAACAYGHGDVARFLLDRGVDIAALDGQTALHLAAHEGHLETVRLLLSRGAPLEVKNRYGGTVLDQTLWSAVHGDAGVDYLPIVEALIDAGAAVEPGRSTGIERIDAVLRKAAR